MQEQTEKKLSPESNVHRKGFEIIILNNFENIFKKLKMIDGLKELSQ